MEPGYTCVSAVCVSSLTVMVLPAERGSLGWKVFSRGLLLCVLGSVRSFLGSVGFFLRSSVRAKDVAFTSGCTATGTTAGRYDMFDMTN